MRRWISYMLMVPAFAFAQAPLELEDCRLYAGPGTPGLSARCGTMERPENPDDPNGATITLKVAVVPALDLDPKPEPIVPIAGGPGQGSISMYIGQRRAFEQLRRDRDILLIDQRGTGDSSKLTCPEDEELMELDFSVELVQASSRDCLAGLPHDPRYFTTSVAVRDIDAVREALGYPAINVYGVSYGSRVAQHYARRYPDKTRSLIIDGVVPPGLPLGPDIALESQKAVEAVLARCEEDVGCRDAFPDIAETFNRVVRRLDTAPVNILISHPVTAQPEELRFGRAHFAAAVRLMLYSPDSIALLPLMIRQADEGNYQPIASMMLMTTGSLSDTLAIGMHNAVMCTEDAPRYVSMGFDDTALDDAYMGPQQYEALKAICSVWPQGFIDDNLHSPLSVDVPTLLLSGTADPITPPEYAERAMAELPNARHIIGTNQGHGVVGVGCMPYLLANFVASADPESVDETCFQERSHVMPFFVDFTGPTP